MISTRALRIALLVPLLAASVPLTISSMSPDPAVAKTTFSKPFMGWSSWSTESTTRPNYGTAWLTEGNIRNATDAVATKLKSAGYSYINIDAGWNATMNWEFHSDANGIPNPDPARFPSGINGIADYIHSKGLKAGIYMAAGLEQEAYNKSAPIVGTSCTVRDIVVLPLTPTNKWGGNWKVDYTKPCAQPYFNSIINKFASWGVDFLKVDGVTVDNVPDIKALSQAIDQSGRAIWLTASAWPVDLSAADGLRPYANGVRIDTDIECYCATTSTWTSSVDDRWSDLPNWLSHVTPNYLPDLDAMPINNNTGTALQDGINDVERQTVMTFWSMASSPLYVGGDVYFMDNSAISILTNPEVIAIDQAAVLPTRITSGNSQVWKKVIGGVTYAAVYNLGSSATNITVNWSALGLSGNKAVRDLVARADLGSFNGSWTASNVPAHGSRLIKIT
ncbi:MAG TPA: glycoside hydrolase family 27 protein [Kribbella sp.]|uniref:glycoside hydrolase family 27 protein n=1 Tax=Kribbella sp. TaxID=1871183 RepID=UPI002D778CA0|nr:glycoside hydrolase family 27 protein [Kribbella sp.]HET6295567.1 glycoside hydrolase family 27 protein [Kribbella sp.]